MIFNYSYWQYSWGSGQSGYYGTSGWSNTGQYLAFTQIPTMTSNTTPSGIAFSNDGVNQTGAWMAFTPYTSFNAGQTYFIFPNFSYYVQYQFPQPTLVYAMSFHEYPIGNTLVYTLSASNDNINYTNLGIAGSGGTGNIQGIYNSNFYTFYRFTPLSNGIYADVYIENLQMYGYYTI